MQPTIFDETQPKIPRAKRPNPWNYTDAECAKKDLAVRDMVRDHPNLPPKWCDWLYDVVTHKTQEEVEEIMASGAWDKPMNVDRETGGIIKGGMEVLPAPIEDLSLNTN